MKFTIAIIATLVISALLMSTGCDSSAKKVADAQEKVNDAKENVSDAEYDLYIAKHDSTADYRTFKRESEDRIAKLDKKIAELKLKISKEKRNQKSESLKLLNDLELKTAQLKKELIEYVEDKNNDWIGFRDNFNKNLDELGISISNFFSDTK